MKYFSLAILSALLATTSAAPTGDANNVIAISPAMQLGISAMDSSLQRRQGQCQAVPCLKLWNDCYTGCASLSGPPWYTSGVVPFVLTSTAVERTVSRPRRVQFVRVAKSVRLGALAMCAPKLMLFSRGSCVAGCGDGGQQWPQRPSGVQVGSTEQNIRTLQVCETECGA